MLPAISLLMRCNGNITPLFYQYARFLTFIPPFSHCSVHLLPPGTETLHPTQAGWCSCKQHGSWWRETWILRLLEPLRVLYTTDSLKSRQLLLLLWSLGTAFRCTNNEQRKCKFAVHWGKFKPSQKNNFSSEDNYSSYSIYNRKKTFPNLQPWTCCP